LHVRDSKVLTDAVVVGAFTVLVKLAGAAKVVFSAHLLGAGDQFDAFVIAFVIPSFLGEVLGGSLIFALIPTLIEVRERQGEEAAHELYSSILIWAAVLLSAVAILAALGSGVIVKLLGSNFSAEKAHLTRNLFLAMTAVIPLSGISMTWRAVLNSKEKFAAAAGIPILTPIVSIALIVTAGHALGAFSLAFGATIGTLAEVLLLAIALRTHGIRLLPSRPRWTQPARQVLTQYAPMAIGGIMLSGSNLIDQLMAARLVTGSVSALNFGTRVTGVIIAIGPAALSTAILPRFSKMTALGDWPALRGAVKRYALLSLILSIPATACCIYFSESIVRIIFQRGAFSAQDTHLVARVQMLSLLQVPMSMLLALVVRLVSALKANDLLLRMAVLSVVANFALDYALMRSMGVAGIALATPLVTLLSLSFLAYLLARRVKTLAIGAY
jgi:putative peptidoglycan lipid II flippase